MTNQAMLKSDRIEPLSADKVAIILWHQVKYDKDLLSRWFLWPDEIHSGIDMEEWIKKQERESQMAWTILANPFNNARQPVGMVVIRNSHIMVWINSKWEGQGLATQACQEAIAEFNGILFWNCDSRNYRSIALAQRLGFEKMWIRPVVFRGQERLQLKYIRYNTPDIREIGT